MVVVYKGGIEELVRQLGEKSAALDAAYENALGRQNAQKVAEIAAKTLVRESFFEDLTAFNAFAGADPSKKRSNQFNVYTPSSVHPSEDGLFAPQDVSITPVFYVSRAGVDQLTKAREPETLLSSYIHAFNNFVWYALQNPPIYMITPYSGAGIMDKIDRILEAEMSREERWNALRLPMISRLTLNLRIRTTELLDSLVLSAVGVHANIGWRNKPNGYYVHTSPQDTGFKVAFPDNEGDPFASSQKGNQRIVQDFVKWQIQLTGPESIRQYGNPHNTYRNLVNSLVENVIVKRVPVTEVKHNPA